MMSDGKTRDQQRAAHAWGVIEKLRGMTPEDRAHLVRAAKKLPVRIHTAGLGHAVQFVKAKDKTKAFPPFLSEWVLQGKGDLVEAVRNGTADSLRRHTAESLAWLLWFNRFAEAEFRNGEE